MNDVENRIYLDHNATTKPFPEVVELMSKTFVENFANPGSRHGQGRQARVPLESCRERMAEILGAKPEEIVFTSGGTESINMAIFGFVGEKPGTIALTAGEHPATIESCGHIKSRGWKLHNLQVDSRGLLIEDQYDRLPWAELKLVTVILAHNETGVIQDMTRLSELCREHRIPLHLDAVQAAGKIPVDFRKLGVTAMSVGAHKFYGPRGVGALILKEGTPLRNRLFGGHQENGIRPGTEPVALIVGMTKALEMFHENCEERIDRISALRNRLQDGLKQKCEPVVVNGEDSPRLPNTLNISFPGLEGESLLVAFDLAGISCSLGSTCSSGASEPAPSLIAMGCSEEVYKSAVRFSVGIGNTEEEIDQAIERIATVVTQQRSL